MWSRLFGEGLIGSKSNVLLPMIISGLSFQIFLKYIWSSGEDHRMTCGSPHLVIFPSSVVTKTTIAFILHSVWYRNTRIPKTKLAHKAASLYRWQVRKRNCGGAGQGPSHLG